RVVSGTGIDTLVPTNTGIDKLPGITLEITAGIVSSDQFLIRPTYHAASRIEVNITEGRKIAAAQNFNSDTGAIINGAMPGDNSNALKLSRLATNTDMFEGTLSYQDVYGGLVSNVGGKSHIAKISAAAQETLWTAANGAREGLAGVNLDEEAANLVRFQQSYQAAAQAISTASSMFDTLMGAVR
ncbi:MAG: flagellar basal body rod C-terminal domain-containing protein, partial [Methyloprofundus sp.]|nr:flagellar basal body rod C-terminal domain-containing protein [Methyloprofundus sp.]